MMNSCDLQSYRGDSEMINKTETGNEESIDLERRSALAKLGLGVSASFVAPILLAFSDAHASGGEGGESGGEGGNQGEGDDGEGNGGEHGDGPGDDGAQGGDQGMAGNNNAAGGNGAGANAADAARPAAQ
jgi:hypothetical protein